MAYEIRESSGTLFPVRSKVKDTQPDLEGTILLNGQEYWINGWRKQGRNGEWFSLSLKVKEKRAPVAKVTQPTAAPAADAFVDDDIPW